MKKHIILSIIMVAIIGMSNVLAQGQGKIRASLSGALGTQSSIDISGSKTGFGISFTADYFATDDLSIALGYTFFFSSSVSIPSLDVNMKASTVDLDGKYYFLNESVAVYGLFGVSYGFVELITTFDLGNGPITEPLTDNKFGINLGAGADYYLSEKLFLNAQAKYNLPLEQVVINLGVGFSLN